MPIRRFAPAVALAIVAACDGTPDRPAIQSLQAGVVKIAVTRTTATDPLDPEQWMYRYAKRFGESLGLRVEWHVVPFDKSWELAGQDVVDVVATNLASFPDRVSPEARSRSRSSSNSARSVFARSIGRSTAPSPTSSASGWAP